MTTNTTNENTYGEALRAARAALGLTQRQFGARLTGRTSQKGQQLVSRLERGVRVQSQAEAERLAGLVRDALRVNEHGLHETLSALLGTPPVFKQAGAALVAPSRVRSPIFVRASWSCARCGCVISAKAAHGARVSAPACVVCGSATVEVVGRVAA